MSEESIAVDLVCGMTVDTATAEYRSFYDSKAYYFCSAGCKVSFDKDPEKFISASAKGKGSGDQKLPRELSEKQP